MSIDQTITLIENGPRRKDPSNYVVKADYFAGAIENLSVELIQFRIEINLTQVAINQSESNAATSAALAGTWAKYLGGLVEGTDYSSKEHAIGNATTTGSSKNWAQKLDTKVAGLGWSSKEHAVGDAVESGSSKNWATRLGVKVADLDWSSKEWAIGGDVPEGSAKAWAIGSPAEGSAKQHALVAKGYSDSAAISSASALSAPGTNATSAASLTIAKGIQSFSIQTGKSLVVGMSVKIAYVTDPARWMHGVIISYDSVTGALVVDVSDVNLTGTYADWVISISAPVPRSVQNFAFAIGEEVQLLSGATNQPVNILPAGAPFLYSADGVNWISEDDGFTANVTGDLYIGGMKSVGFPVYTGVETPVNLYRAAALNGGIYNCAGGANITRYSLPSMTPHSSVTATSYQCIAAVGGDLIALTNSTDLLETYVGGDITIPSTGSVDFSRLGHDPKAIAHNGADLFMLSQRVAPSSVTHAIHPDGTKVYIFTTGKQVFEIPLLVNGELDSMDWGGAPSGIELDQTFGGNTSWFVSPDGLHVYGMSTSADTVYEGELSVAWDFNTFTDTGRSMGTMGETSPTWFTISPDGTKIHYIGTAQDRLKQQSLSTAWNLSTADGSPIDGPITSQNANRFFWRRDGMAYHEYVTATNVGWTEVTCLSAWEITGASTTATKVGVGNLVNAEYQFSLDGSRLQTVAGSTVYTALVSVDGDITTAAQQVITTLMATYVALTQFTGVTAVVQSVVKLGWMEASTSIDFDFIDATTIVLIGGPVLSNRRVYTFDIATPENQIHYTNSSFNEGHPTAYPASVCFDGVDAYTCVIDAGDRGKYELNKLSSGGSAVVFGV